MTQIIKPNSNESGMVSIIVTVVLMTIISITVLSFAQIIRREQREAIDNQLSSQAFYAAESGINDVQTLIKAAPANTAVRDKTECGPTAAYPTTVLPMQVSKNVSYSCLLIDGSPRSLVYRLDAETTSRVIPITTADGVYLDNLDISWQKSDPDDTEPLDGCFTTIADFKLPQSGGWDCGYGMIRIDLVPIPPAGNMTMASLAGSTFTAFLAPTTGGTTSVAYSGATNINSGTAAQAISTAAKCTKTSCNVRITGVYSNSFYARVTTLYKDAPQFTISSNNGANKLKGAQITIDSTGKAQDVLRRVRVHVPLVTTGLHADYGILSNDSICKLLTTPGNSPNEGCNDAIKTEPPSCTIGINGCDTPPDEF